MRLGVADLQRGRVDEADAGGGSQTAGDQIRKQRHHDARDQVHEARIADQVGEVVSVMGQQIQVEVFEISEVAGLERDEEGHDFAARQLALPPASGPIVDQPVAFQLDLEALGEIVHIHK